MNPESKFRPDLGLCRHVQLTQHKGVSIHFNFCMNVKLKENCMVCNNYQVLVTLKFKFFSYYYHFCCKDLIRLTDKHKISVEASSLLHLSRNWPYLLIDF